MLFLKTKKVKDIILIKKCACVLREITAGSVIMRIIKTVNEAELFRNTNILREKSLFLLSHPSLQAN